MITVAAVVGSVLLAAMLLIAVHDALRRPAFRRLAVRNLMRRRTEAILVVLGSSLGTAVIASAFVVGATFHASLRDGARTRLGPIDEQVQLANPNQLAQVVDALARPPLNGTDGTLATRQAPVSITNERGTLVEPAGTFGELNIPQARQFGGHPKDTGLATLTTALKSREVIINARLGATLHVHAGDDVVIHAWGQHATFHVVKIVSPIGLAGATDVIGRPNALQTLVPKSGLPRALQPVALVWVSNHGTVFDSSAQSPQIVSDIHQRLAGRFAVTVTSVKADLLRDAEARGRSLGELFAGVGTFSVLAGVLLLVNLFVMLAQERKKELGLARATGLARGHLVRILTLEGACFGVAAAFVGAFLGTLVALIIAHSASSLVGHGDNSFQLHFVAPTGVLVVAALIGLGISMATAWVTSARIARLNIVRALRDLPEDARRRHRWSSSGPAGVGVLTGVALTLWGVIAVIPLAALLGPALGLTAALPLLRPHLGRRVSTAIVSGGTLIWCVGVFTFLRRIAQHTSVPVFVVQGVIMVAAAVGLATALDRVWSIGVGVLGRTGKAVAGRLGLAYPLEDIFRTGLLIGMYALIIFTLTFLVVYAKISSNQTAMIAQRVSAGANVLVDANPTSSVSAHELAAVQGVDHVATVWRSAPQFSTATHPNDMQWPLSGFDRSLLVSGVPSLSARAPQFTSDRAVFSALLHDPHLIVVDDRFLNLQGTSAPGSLTAGVGSIVHARDPQSGKTADFRVIGVTRDDLISAGAWASLSTLQAFAGQPFAPTRFYVQVRQGSDPQAVADALEARFGSLGVQAAPFASKVSDQLSVEVGFLDLMRRYLFIGLIVGIFGLAVVMVRASRSRRRQIGMLRTIGFTADTVRRVFLVEAAFISFQGIATGVGLGLLVSYQMLSRSASLGGEPLPYAVPWETIGALAFIPFAASLAVALIPASQASAVDPAQVLRMAD